MSFAKFLIDKWRSRDPGYNEAHGLPIEVIEGQWYSTLTGSDPPTIEINWDALQRDIEQLEAEFKAANAPAKE
jgi:hypothetical protein